MLITTFIARLLLIALCSVAAFLPAIGTADAQPYFATLYPFQGSPTNCSSSCDGQYPYATLIMDGMGNLYGTTSAGGGVPNCPTTSCTSGAGTVFELSPPGSPSCATPSRGLWCETVLHGLGLGGDGMDPMAGLIMDGQNNLYGTAKGGGSGSAGTVFELTPNQNPNQYQTAWTWAGAIYQFCLQGGVCPDGSQPVAGLVTDGTNLFGTTMEGGAGYGVAFELSPPSPNQTSWQRVSMHGFCSPPCGDGLNPAAGLILIGTNYYGTTVNGAGAGAYTPAGTVFELSPAVDGQCPTGSPTNNWCEAVIYSFCTNYVINNCTDGANPSAGLVTDGTNLYGTTSAGGANGLGTVFELVPIASGSQCLPSWNSTTSGWCHNIIYSFCPPTQVQNGICTDGAEPAASLYRDTAGNLYGTTQLGGLSPTGSYCFRGCGVVFELMPIASGSACAPGWSSTASNWCQNVLYKFCSQFQASTNICTDGAEPAAGLYRDTAGNLYGTTVNGGVSPSGTLCVQGCGVVFAVYAEGLTVNVSGSGTVTSQPPGISCPPTCSANFAGGTLVTLTAVAPSGSVLSSWSGGGCSGNGACQIPLNGAVTVSAEFVSNNPPLCSPFGPGVGASLQFSLSVSVIGRGKVTSSPSGISCRGECSANLRACSYVTLTASGGAFKGWTAFIAVVGGPQWITVCKGNLKCRLWMTAPVSLRATFR
jgi:uncharacterized repeat protein (TIGR03803 family)